MSQDDFVSSSSLVGLSSSLALTGLSVSDTLDGRLQCGVDLVDIDRIASAVERWGDRFVSRVWTEREIAYCRGRIPELAARFAAKEATSKALGTGFVDLVWRDIEILPDRRGKPLLFLHGAAKERAEALKLNDWAISLSHSRIMACAMVVACADS
ncbi:MAG: holo-ACP synthase [Chloroflexia bacterium]